MKIRLVYFLCLTSVLGTTPSPQEDVVSTPRGPTKNLDSQSNKDPKTSEKTPDDNVSNKSPDNAGNLAPTPTPFPAEESVSTPRGPTAPKPKQTVDNGPKEEQKEPVCFDTVGCFDVNKPWYTKGRPCSAPMHPKKLGTKLWYYSKPYPDHQHELYTYPDVHPHRIPFSHTHPTYLISHGLASSGDASWLREIAEPLIRRWHANVIVINWGKVALTGYPNNLYSACGNIRVVAAEVSHALHIMIKERSLNVSTTHCVGHSFGAHICGYIGKNMTASGFQLASITALDACQELFETNPTSVRLALGDAKIIIGHHTDAAPIALTRSVGYVGPIGDIDIYYNGGWQQPGCLDLNTAINITSFASIGEELYERGKALISCSHGRAHYYFAEALKSNNCTFWAHRAKIENFMSGVVNTITNGEMIKFTALGPDCNKPEDCVPVGYETFLYPGRGVYVVNTNAASPFCVPTKEAIDPEKKYRLGTLVFTGFLNAIVKAWKTVFGSSK